MLGIKLLWAFNLQTRTRHELIRYLLRQTGTQRESFQQPEQSHTLWGSYRKLVFLSNLIVKRSGTVVPVGMIDQYFLIIHADYALITDCDTVGVAAKIADNLFRIGEFELAVFKGLPKVGDIVAAKVP